MIFISYRTSDGAHIARAVAKALEVEFDVFLDKSTMELGSFPPQLERGLRAASTVVCIVTPDYISEERLSDPEDWVRRELEIAAVSEKLIVPVVVEGLDLDRRSLHSSVESLRDAQRLPLAHTTWDDDLDRIVRKVAAAHTTWQRTKKTVRRIAASQYLWLFVIGAFLVGVLQYYAPLVIDRQKASVQAELIRRLAPDLGRFVREGRDLIKAQELYLRQEPRDVATFNQQVEDLNDQIRQYNAKSPALTVMTDELERLVNASGEHAGTMSKLLVTLRTYESDPNFQSTFQIEERLPPAASDEELKRKRRRLSQRWQERKDRFAVMLEELTQHSARIRQDVLSMTRSVACPPLTVSREDPQ